MSISTNNSNQPPTLLKSIVSKASFLSLSLLSALLSASPYIPPPPNFEPTRFWWSKLNVSGVLLFKSTLSNPFYRNISTIHSHGGYSTTAIM